MALTLTTNEIRDFVGIRRFEEYANYRDYLSHQQVIELYVFDTELRGLLLRAFAVIEIAFRALISQHEPNPGIDTFNSIRGALAKLPDKNQFQIAKRLNLSNQLEMDSVLRNMIALRNRVAHHERVWNSKTRFPAPKIGPERFPKNWQVETDTFSTASTLKLIALIFNDIPNFLDLENEFNKLVQQCDLERIEIMEGMGFEVP